MNDPETSMDELVTGLGRLAGALSSVESLDATLGNVVASAVSSIEPCDAAGLFVLDELGRRVAAVSDARAAELDQAHESVGGPAADALATGLAVVVDDVEREFRYPAFATVASALGIATVLAYPLSAGSRRGALSLYGTRPAAFDAADRAKGAVFAAVAGLAAGAAAQHQAEQAQNVALRRALVTRQVIGQAQGILMERDRVTADQAFEILRRASQHLNEKLHDVDQKLVDTGESPRTGKRAPTA